jgi:hypothetical protein
MRMQLNDFQNSAIRVLGVTGFTLQYSTINGVSGSASGPVEGAIAFGTTNPSGSNGLFGTNLIDNCRISGAVEHNVEWYNQSGTASLTVSNSDIKSNSVAFGSDGILVEMQGTAGALPGAEVLLTVDNVVFDDNKSQAVQVAANDSSRVYATIRNSTVSRTSQGNEGFVLSNGSNGQLRTLVSGNTITGLGGATIFVGQTAGNATSSSNLIARITGNVITHPTTATNSAIIAFTTSTVGQTAPAAIRIDNNNVTQNSTSGVARGIFVDTPDTSTTPSTSATVLGNTVSVGDNVAGLGGVVVQSRRGSLCARIQNNTVTYPNGNPGVQGVRLRQVAPGSAILERGGSVSSDAATVLQANNSAATTEVLGTGTVVGNGVCTVVSLP